VHFIYATGPQYCNSSGLESVLSRCYTIALIRKNIVLSELVDVRCHRFTSHNYSYC